MTVAHGLIAQSGGWNKPSDALRECRGQLGKRSQFIGVQIDNLTNALGDGRATDLIFNRLEALKDEQCQVLEKLAQTDKEIEAATIKRPTAQQVMASWSHVLKLWEGLSGENRARVLGGIVERVEVQQKTV